MEHQIHELTQKFSEENYGYYSDDYYSTTDIDKHRVIVSYYFVVKYSNLNVVNMLMFTTFELANDYLTKINTYYKNKGEFYKIVEMKNGYMDLKI